MPKGRRVVLTASSWQFRRQNEAPERGGILHQPLALTRLKSRMVARPGGSVSRRSGRFRGDVDGAAVPFFRCRLTDRSGTILDLFPHPPPRPAGSSSLSTEHHRDGGEDLGRSRAERLRDCIPPHRRGGHLHRGFRPRRRRNTPASAGVFRGWGPRWGRGSGPPRRAGVLRSTGYTPSLPARGCFVREGRGFRPRPSSPPTRGSFAGRLRCDPRRRVLPADAGVLQSLSACELPGILRAWIARTGVRRPCPAIPWVTPAR